MTAAVGDHAFPKRGEYCTCSPPYGTVMGTRRVGVVGLSPHGLNPSRGLSLVHFFVLGMRSFLSSGTISLFTPTDVLPMNSGQGGTNARGVCPLAGWHSVHQEVPRRGVAVWDDRAKWHLQRQESSH